MQVRTGLEIVRLHQEYKDKINELELCAAKMEGHEYARKVLEGQIDRLRIDLQTIEGTRFQALDPVNIVKSMLGGVTDTYSQQ